MHSRCSALPFSLSLIFAVADEDAKPLRRALRALPAGVCVALRPTPLSLQLRAILVWVLACLARCHARLLAQLALSLCGLLGFVQSSSPTWSPLAITLGFVPLLLLVLRLDKASLGSSTPYCVIASNTSSSCLTVFRRLLLCPVSHHLVDWQVFRNTCAIIAGALALARATIPLASSSACSIYRVASLSPLLGASQPLYGLLLTLTLRALGAPQSVLEPRRVRQVFFLALSSRVLSASLEARLRDNLILAPQFLSTLVIVALCPSVRPCQIRYVFRPFQPVFLGLSFVLFSLPVFPLSWFNCSSLFSSLISWSSTWSSQSHSLSSRSLMDAVIFS